MGVAAREGRHHPIRLAVSPQPTAFISAELSFPTTPPVVASSCPSAGVCESAARVGAVVEKRLEKRQVYTAGEVSREAPGESVSGAPSWIILDDHGDL